MYLFEQYIQEAKNDGIETVMNAMNNHWNVVDVQTYGCMALRNLKTEEKILEEYGCQENYDLLCDDLL